MSAAEAFRPETFRLHDVTLRSGEHLATVETTYLTRGRLNRDGTNAILVLHGYTGGHDIIDPTSDPLDGSWRDLVGPGLAIDTDEWFVVAPTALGSGFGATNGASIDPRTGAPYGKSFPRVTVEDIVAIQYALLQHLGVMRLHAAAGASFGGLMALEWGISHPNLVSAVVCATAAPRMPGVDIETVAGQVARVRSEAAHDPSAVERFLVQSRLATLRRFGAADVMAQRHPAPADADAALTELARRWAGQFELSSLEVLFRAMGEYDATDRLPALSAPLFYALVDTDPIVPSSLAPAVLERLERSGVQVTWHELHSPFGHSATSTDPHAWSDELAAFLRQTHDNDRKVNR